MVSDIESLEAGMARYWYRCCPTQITQAEVQTWICLLARAEIGKASFDLVGSRLDRLESWTREPSMLCDERRRLP